MASASIYGQYATPVRSVADYTMDAQRLQSAQQGNALEQLKLQSGQRDFADTNALRSLMASGVDLSTPQGQAQLWGAAPTQAGAMLKMRADIAKTGADTTLANAHAGKFLTDTQAANIAQHRDALSQVSDPVSAIGWAQAGRANGTLDDTQYQSALTNIMKASQDPAAFNAWKQQAALGATKYIEMNKPTLTTQNLGGTSQIVATPGLGGPSTVQSSAPITQSADNVAANQTRLQAAGIAASTSRANNAANIAKDYAVMGIQPGGGLNDNMERTAQAIANGQMPAPSGMALLNPRNQLMLGRVMEINPQYDSTTVAAKKKAASDFTTGPLGNSMRSFAVAGQHLDQLGTLVDALDNGNMQIVNKVGNIISQQTGSPAPTNFDAAKAVVSKEVVKAIVAGGGGVGEREELSNLMNNAKSPAQLKGVITQYRALMGAQHDALLQQRRAAGLPDSTLPNYLDANGSQNSAGAPPNSAGAPPADIADLLKKYGK